MRFSLLCQIVLSFGYVGIFALSLLTPKRKVRLVLAALGWTVGILYLVLKEPVVDGKLALKAGALSLISIGAALFGGDSDFEQAIELEARGVAASQRIGD